MKSLEVKPRPSTRAEQRRYERRYERRMGQMRLPGFEDILKTPTERKREAARLAKEAGDDAR